MSIQEIMYCFVALVSIINPLGSAGIILANTAQCTAGERRMLAQKIALYGFLFLLAVIFAGNPILTFFGLQLKFVEIGGGMVILASAWKILMNNDSKPVDAEPALGNVRDKAFVPLTFPFTVGPGCVAVTLGLMARAENHGSKFSVVALYYVEMIIAALMAMICVWLVYRYVNVISKALGTTGTKVAVKMLMFLLLCMGIEMVYDGIVLMK
ncbi:MAG: MarC family protein [Negativicutes bacterium]|jgi:multiple antibiotic resistance protein